MNAANIDRFNLATDLRYRKQYSRSGPAPPGELNLGLIGAGRIGDVRLRGSTSFDITPDARFRSAELSAYWSASERVDWEGGVIYDAAAKRARARVTHIRRLPSMAVALTAEAASDGSAALGLNLNFSLDPGGGFKLFCNGLGKDYPDVANASRPMKKSEWDACQAAGAPAAWMRPSRTATRWSA